MPKRKNPYGDYSHLQLKQHVGVKEIDFGIAQENNMKDVYERTRQLLFNGSKKSFVVSKDSNCNDICITQLQPDHLIGDNISASHGQMQIACNGQLINPVDSPSKNAFQVLMMAKKGSTQSCCQCCRGQAASQDRCGFCEKSICYDCVRSCSICNAHFCQLCSIMNPDDPVQLWYCQECCYRSHPHLRWHP